MGKVTLRRSELAAEAEKYRAAHINDNLIDQMAGFAMQTAARSLVRAMDSVWQPIETKPDRPMPVLYLHTRLKWTDIHGNPATLDAVRDAAERISVGFWNGRNWCESGTGHDVFEDWHDVAALPTHWRPLPVGPLDTSPADPA